MSYRDYVTQANRSIEAGAWEGITADSVARMRLQNRFKTGLDIAKYTAAIMRKDMAAYDADPTKYTQSLGCWHGFIGQQQMIAVKKHFGATDRRYMYLSGWMVAALRCKLGRQICCRCCYPGWLTLHSRSKFRCGSIRSRRI